MSRQFAEADKARALNEIKNAPCADCGRILAPSRMHFDHRDPSTKQFNVSAWRRHDWEAVIAEIGKCDLVCVVCHGVRTAQQVRAGVFNHYDPRPRYKSNAIKYQRRYTRPWKHR